MKHELLLLLSEERARAALCWSMVDRRKRPLPLDVKVPGAAVYYNPDEWMRLADLPFHAHAGLADVLFKAEMITADGRVDPEVVSYARRAVLRHLSK